jgi:hypothetical protein
MTRTAQVEMRSARMLAPDGRNRTGSTWHVHLPQCTDRLLYGRAERESVIPPKIHVSLVPFRPMSASILCRSTQWSPVAVHRPPALRQGE